MYHLTNLVTRSLEYILDMILFKVIPLKCFASCLPPLNIGTMIPSVQLLGYKPLFKLVLYSLVENGNSISHELLNASGISKSVPELLPLMCDIMADFTSISVNSWSRSISCI